MVYFRRTITVIAVGGVIAVPAFGPAGAKPEAQHFIGEECIGADIGRRDVAPDGRAIICGSTYRWEPDIGQHPNDPWVTGQNP